ncbi:zeta toxin family protein [Zooshikella ganghwensis]|uniref:Zeta toxin domain-containing protein n=1 Tax=Zooshikella ganghwensis TaxID=202772 RepID=A0A4P9VH98_9GAMM|nr:zeta toxin family protein [Zooshikella ganghwensis]RDH41814.1 hypothetical protein B9G39_26685 [Zooshikella ganghwensis]RDH41846.1 hypothetical protein B9G39_25825 [Zooshikella ganghwensis]
MLTKQYVLPKEIHDNIFENEIKPFHLAKSQTQEKPLAIITGGQPGSGKSGITSEAKKDDIQAANLTHQDASQWAIFEATLSLINEYNS